MWCTIVGPIYPISHSGNKYILTIQDNLSKFSVAIPLKDQERKTVANAFVINYICMYGLPKMITTDQGSNFMSGLFKQICKLLKIDKINSTAYHPESIGSLERSHRTLGEYLRTFTEKDPMNWDIWIPYYLFAYNSTPHTAHNFMPFEMLYGYQPNIPNSIKNHLDPLYNHDDYCAELKYRLQTAWQIAKQKIVEKKLNQN